VYSHGLEELAPKIRKTKKKRSCESHEREKTKRVEEISRGEEGLGQPPPHGSRPDALLGNPEEIKLRVGGWAKIRERPNLQPRKRK